MSVCSSVIRRACSLNNGLLGCASPDRANVVSRQRARPDVFLRDDNCHWESSSQLLKLIEIWCHVIGEPTSQPAPVARFVVPATRLRDCKSGGETAGTKITRTLNPKLVTLVT